MLRVAFRLAVGVVPIFISGCAQYQWQKMGVTQDEFRRDLYACQMEAAQAFPAAYVRQQLTTGYRTPDTTYCSGSSNAYGAAGSVYGSSSSSCTTVPGRTVSGLATDTDANENNRQIAARSCMYARGYTLVEVK